VIRFRAWRRAERRIGIPMKLVGLTVTGRAD
jgi:hypothetical protein